MSKKKEKVTLREFWILEAETGWDIKRYVRSLHEEEELAKALLKYLQLKNPYDKYEIIHCKEIRK